MDLKSLTPYKDFLFIAEAGVNHEGSIEKAKELLDWKPEISINEGIESVINWYLDNEKIASKINLYF